ncbi:MAG TPA: enoyl-CoA hydratase/isomerase family protein [Spirochaetota bacterium]|nr:enoyl-CoA hydratase/isomerase family protein [Spirochaetota bacterium]HPJ35976.1 enoyl-CoA hydratase/isomerase family protein [Spirochaetota bacterium]
MAYEAKIEDGIIIFKFNNPKVNAINMETLKGLDEAVDKLNSDDSLKGMVLTGEGRFFSGGFCLNTFTAFSNGADVIEWFKFEENTLLKLFTCKKPVISAINGGTTAAGMIYSMASDYRIAVDNPKIKVGMTEIKIGLSLSPCMGNVMRFGLDTDRNYRDIIMKGELVDPAFCVERGIFDELTTAEELIDKAKAKVVALYDTLLNPFIELKSLQKRDMAALIQKELAEYDWNIMGDTFMDEKIKKLLGKVLASIS